MNENLPQWDLSELYSDINDPKITEDIENVKIMVQNFAIYKDILQSVQGDGLYDAINKYENINKILARLYVFAYLTYVTNIASEVNKVFLQTIKDAYSNIISQLVFFELEINNITQEKIDEILSHGGKILKYAPYLRDVRKFKKHILSEEIESLLIKKDSTGISTLVKLFDENTARLKFNINGQVLNISQALDKLSSKNREERQAAGCEIGNVFAQNAWFYSIIINTIAKDKSNMDEYRNYDKPISYRNLSNFIEDDVVNCLINSVKNRYSQISHRYYKIKAKLLGLEKLEYYDRNAPIQFDSDRTYTFEEAKDLTLRAYNAFCPQIGSIVQKFFDNNWIDAQVGEFKMSGAFCCSTNSDLHPFVMLNFLGKARDVATLAHELGHGVHMYLSQSQGQLMQDTPLTLAETASIFGEQLVFQEMLQGASSPQEKLILLCQKVDDMINTVIRQIAFCDFELKIHNMRKESELTSDQICNVWLKVQSESLGEHVILSDNYKYYWTYISHFIHSPFYVYAYAFGDLLVNSLYKLYQNGTLPNFQEKYATMLSMGGTLHHTELLKPFNVSLNNENFWNMGLQIIEDMVSEIEHLASLNDQA